MGSYGIGVERIAAAAVEISHDKDGILWPASIAPYDVSLLALQQQDAELVAVCDLLYQELTQAGLDVIYDDRDERPGVKFKDADLIGLPYRIAVGKKSLAEGSVELKRRGAADIQLVKIGAVPGRLRSLLDADLDALLAKANATA
jgi:prolyl-tRNA synthetase